MKVSLNWFLLILIVICFNSCETDTGKRIIPPQPTFIRIAHMLAFTGNSSSIGLSCSAAIQLAEEDINEWIQATDQDWCFVFEPWNSAGHPDSALVTLNDINGYNIVIGPTTSSEAANICDFAKTKDILLVSPSSTAISVAIPGDNLYRLTPDDGFQAKAISAMLEADTVEVLIPISRDDVWGNDLLSATRDEYEASGGIVVEGLNYDPFTEDFSNVMDTFSNRVDEVLAEYPEAKIGIYALTFGEITSIFYEMRENQTLINLSWYGGSGTAQNSNLVANGLVAPVAESIRFTCPIFGDNNSAEYEDLKTRLSTKISRQPESYAFAAYDAACVAAKSYYELGTPEPNFSDLKEKIYEICETYVGVTGQLTLNEAGDMQFGNYDFWAIVESSGTYEWVKTARYEIDPVTFNGILVRY